MDPRRPGFALRVVADASVLVDAFGNPEGPGVAIREWLMEAVGDSRRFVIIDTFTQLEVQSAWRKAVAAGRMDDRWAAYCVAQSQHWPAFADSVRLTQSDRVRVWELRHAFTIYDAAYLAVTERLMSEEAPTQVALATLDYKMAGSTQLPVPVLVPPTV